MFIIVKALLSLRTEVRITEDKEIIDLYLNRDERAIEKTADKYGKRLRKLATEITGDYQTAEECENDTYIRAWNTIPPKEPYDYFYAFLVSINRNIALNICRSRNTLKRSVQIEELNSELEQIIPASDTTDDQLLQEIINLFLAGISSEKRNIFIRRYWYMDSISQIAEGFGISESKVKIVLYRLRNKLKKVLEKEGYTL